MSEGQEWDYNRVKAIAGQGKVYVRLNKPKKQLLGNTSGDNNGNNLQDHDELAPSSASTRDFCVAENSGLSTSVASVCNNDEIGLDQLENLFPGKPRSYFQTILNNNPCLQEH